MTDEERALLTLWRDRMREDPKKWSRHPDFIPVSKQLAPLLSVDHPDRDEVMALLANPNNPDPYGSVLKSWRGK